MQYYTRKQHWLGVIRHQAWHWPTFQIQMPASPHTIYYHARKNLQKIVQYPDNCSIRWYFANLCNQMAAVLFVTMAFLVFLTFSTNVSVLKICISPNSIMLINNMCLDRKSRKDQDYIYGRHLDCMMHKNMYVMCKEYLETNNKELEV